MYFKCCIVRAWKGTAKARQISIVESLGGVHDTVATYIWWIHAVDTPEGIKAVEKTLGDRVPFCKESDAEHAVWLKDWNEYNKEKAAQEGGS